MPINFLETKLTLNDTKVYERHANAHFDLNNFNLSASFEKVLHRKGVDFRQETIRYETEVSSDSDSNVTTLAGLSLGAEVGSKTTTKGDYYVAKVELSAGRAERNVSISEDFSMHFSANLNANTGFVSGPDGNELTVLGFGLTLGLCGKWSINTPFGSTGFNNGSPSIEYPDKPKIKERVEVKGKKKRSSNEEDDSDGNSEEQQIDNTINLYSPKNY